MTAIPENYHRYGLSIDCAAHWLHDFNTDNNETDTAYKLKAQCRICNNNLYFRYYEEKLCSVSCPVCDYTMLIHADDPEHAARYLQTQQTTTTTDTL